MGFEDEIVSKYMARIGARGGRAASGKKKHRPGSEKNLQRYWEEVRAGKRPPPERIGRPKKKPAQEVKEIPALEIEPVTPKTIKRKEEPQRRNHVPIHTTQAKKPGRNDKCPCGSGKKYKKCCGA